jgi:PBP1b-binding outer membrane lipoprotein LpoB
MKSDVSLCAPASVRRAFACAAVLLLLTACSGNGGGDNDSTPTNVSPAPQVATSPLHRLELDATPPDTSQQGRSSKYTITLEGYAP